MFLGGPHLKLFGFGVPNSLSGPTVGTPTQGKFCCFRGVGAGEKQLTFTICLMVEDFTSPTPNPETSLPPSTSNVTETLLEPTTDREPKPAAMHECVQEETTELSIAPEPKPHDESGQVCELATLWIAKGV